MTSGIPSPRAQKYYAHRFASDSSPTPLISVHQSKQRRVDEKAEHDAFLAKVSSMLFYHRLLPNPNLLCA